MTLQSPKPYHEIGAFDAKTRLAELLRQVEEGEGFLITRRGKPVARLLPAQTDKDQDRGALLARMTARRKRLTPMAEPDFQALITRTRL